MTEFGLGAYSPYFIYLVGLNIVFIRQLARQTKAPQIWTLCVSFIYLASVGYLCFTPPLTINIADFGQMKPYYLGPVPMNPIPFRGIGLDFFLNILLTVPLGLCASLFLKQPHFKSLLYLGFAAGFSIELCQYLLDWGLDLGRWVDINDVLMNALGVCLGWLLYQGLWHWPWFQKFKLNR